MKALVSALYMTSISVGDIALLIATATLSEFFTNIVSVLVSSLHYTISKDFPKEIKI